MPRVFCPILLVLLLATKTWASEPERLFYLSKGQVLQGLIYKPAGEGPFPAVIYNQNTTKEKAREVSPKVFGPFANFYTSHGYVLFAPGRRASKDDDSETDAVAGAGDDKRQKQLVSEHDTQASIIFSALETLKAQSYVNPKKIFVTGFAAGAITSLVMAEKELDVRGYVVFSPAAGWWNTFPSLQATVIRCTENAKAPVFVIQAENDHTLLPAKVLGRILESKGPPNAAKVFPAFGNSEDDAKLFPVSGYGIWGADVLSFFNKATK